MKQTEKQIRDAVNAEFAALRERMNAEMYPRPGTRTEAVKRLIWLSGSGEFHEIAPSDVIGSEA